MTLLNCPFCGGAADAPLDPAGMMFDASIQCSICLASGPCPDQGQSHAEAWNTRAQPSDGALTNEGAESVAPAPAFDDAVERAAFEGWYRDQLFWPNEKVFNAAGGAWLACARRHPPKVCTCPSGDGSLRWPCPVHPPEPAAGIWNEGSPPHPWDSEWFLAKMVQGAFVVLRPLPEEYTYDFTTADGTYVMRKSIARWAQLSGSEYIAPASTESRS